MNKELPNFKYELEKKEPRLGPGGITRGVSVKEFKASQNLAGVSMHLEPGAIRELHWHANAAEWGYVLEGQMRTTVIDPQGNVFIDIFNPGDVWYFPRGYGHVLQCISSKSCHFILIFDNGDFSEDHTFSITDFISSVPAEIAAQNLGLTVDEVKQLHQGEAYFAQCELPDIRSGLASAKNEVSLVSKHRYPLGAQQPIVVPGGGVQRVVTQKEFEIAKTITGSIFEIEPGGLRELHWHPNADEWQYYIQGKAEMGVFLAEGQFVKDEFNKGDVGYVPMGAGHYIKNTGTETLIVLLGFNNGLYEAIDLSSWISGNPKDILKGNFGVGDKIVDQLPTSGKLIIK
ncbi:cupin domain-containing protein [Chryseobacterium sp. MEBOG07]|uniref:cupin domain-containing protein n=1 Tax=Chryseobacterium sp. MEBOG07 TaxID=2879939 RepID=UPI001F3C4B71|nr:cupin domain-containing protein [Chryseobacterium sp. MEBOG07]UKB78231.1 cupin domain-containing protein [Chryseobacterium sp. MEBOG07]